MRKYAMLLTTRNKVRHTQAAVHSMFSQVGPPIELLLSDSGSTDGTVSILDDMARSYNGPHKVRRLNCPCAKSPGMGGLNDHINWAMTQTDADVVMQLSGDDYDLAQRSELTIKAFEEHDPSMALGAMYYVSEDMKYIGETPCLDVKDGDRWGTIKDMTENFMGGSTCQAWSREFFEKVGPMDGVGSIDVPWPFLAVLMKGAWLMAPRMHAYRKCLGPSNVGLEGVYHAIPPSQPDKRMQVEENIHFQVMAGHYFALDRMNHLNIATDEAVNALAKCILDRSASWCSIRQKMSFAGIAPIPFKV